MVVIWILNVELIGPTAYQTFVKYLQQNNRIKYDNDDVSVMINMRSERTGLKTIIDDDLLYPALLAVARERYCEENLLFLHEGIRLHETLMACQDEVNGLKQACDPISCSIDVGQSPASTLEPALPTAPNDRSSGEIYKKQVDVGKTLNTDDLAAVPSVDTASVASLVSEVISPSLVAELHRFLDNYLMSDAPMPVNLASAQISALQQARSLGSFRRSGADAILNALLLSLADVQILFEASRVLTIFERSDARAKVLGEREAVVRLGIETEKRENVDSIPD
ncbi:hypothetical protein SARC_09622 [Sphaeroforma arctica JP610]|uniref:Uncharacterized protein n=1 Tax=Sphaeroforma arctica JP610 TaxID=667725 RepID=A0A0L0FMD6_9EUKA|nr:hypothetical protein SARC_09622 [Sphaeroforma arctica JP610]KNC77927.1 hypothetical protein SARC_09622 [Sphaeroforma arctica JP610]|eukprot:XP_014151829.1 hypothetical protein SARC_09622 [Sphaeroforma arctica JP610]